MSNPITSTISSLFQQNNLSSNSTSPPSFDSSNLLLISKGASPPQDKVRGQIKALAEAAEKAATSLACSSILAGQGSEGDDDGDVGIWLGQGDYGEGYESEVLEALGLENWAQEEEIIPVELQPSTLPANLDLKSENVAMDDFTKCFSCFKQPHCFRVKKGGPMSGGSVAFFLLGQLDDHGWGGLVGMGVWSDA